MVSKSMVKKNKSTVGYHLHSVDSFASYTPGYTKPFQLVHRVTSSYVMLKLYKHREA